MDRNKGELLGKDHRERPRISVLIPIYNVEKYLQECLDSVERQSLKEIEIILVDDGSTDSSSSIAALYASNDKRIQVIHHKDNKGLLMARKTAVMRATGDYCCFIDSDDYLTSDDSLHTMLSLTEELNVDIVHFSTDIIGWSDLQESESLQRWFKPYPHRLFGTEEIIRNCFIKEQYNWNLWGKIYRTDTCKKAFRAIPDAYCVMAEDIYTYFIIAFYANTYAGVVTIPFYTYRLRSGVSTQWDAELRSFTDVIEGESFALNSIHSFLMQQGVLPNVRTLLQDVKKRFISAHIQRFDRLSLQLSPLGFTCLVRCWPRSELLSHLLVFYHDKEKTLIEKIIGAE